MCSREKSSSLHKTDPSKQNPSDAPTSSKRFQEFFNEFIDADSAQSAQHSFDKLCHLFQINSRKVFENGYNFKNMNTRLVYKIIQSKSNYWRSNDLWVKYESRASSSAYKSKPNGFKELNVLIVGAGPVGLRLSIECALLGFKCTVIEKRDRFSRNNVLHLWPFCIEDLKNLGAKLFYGKFCAGYINHISIRKLQLILMKVALLMGVQIKFNTKFDEIIEPPMEGDNGWKVRLSDNHNQHSEQSFEVIVGANGAKNTLPGFRRKEFKGKSAIAITANFLNLNQTQDNIVQERSGVNYLFDQKFFKDLKRNQNVDLENIVYYKDETHYFVMTAKKQSLIEHGVFHQTYADNTKLLSRENLNLENLMNYTRIASFHATNKQLKRLEFAKNHNDEPDISIFDFTTFLNPENASRFINRNGRELYLTLVGDSLKEPFWPLGTGIALGFFSAFDTAWALRSWAHGAKPHQVLIERESTFTLLSQTTPSNINQNLKEYSIDPGTRYSRLNLITETSESQVRHLYADEWPLRLSEEENFSLKSFDPKSEKKCAKETFCSLNIQSRSRCQSFQLDTKSLSENQRPIMTHFFQSICYECERKVSIKERVNVANIVLHSSCLLCNECQVKLNPSSSYDHFYHINNHGRCNCH